MRTKKNKNQSPTLLTILIALCFLGYFYLKGQGDSEGAAANRVPSTAVADRGPATAVSEAEASDEQS